MSSHQQILRNSVRSGLMAVTALLLYPVGMQAQLPGESAVSPMPTILDRSPFIPPGWSPPEVRRPKPKAEKKTAGYEFRGVYQLGGEFRFLVSEPRSRSGNWVQVGGSYEGYEVRDFDPKSETLTLFFNDKEVPIKLADLETNPTPIPVTGQVKASGLKASDNSRRPVRRTIRPASRTNTEDGSRERKAAPPPPAWLQKLREEAASRRAQAGGVGAPGGSGVSASGSIGDNPTGFTPPPPPDFTPPTPPPNISEIDIPPPPTTLPPEPPPEIMQQIQQSIGPRTPGT